jgi:hypothetical protein
LMVFHFLHGACCLVHCFRLVLLPHALQAKEETSWCVVHLLCPHVPILDLSSNRFTPNVRFEVCF